MLLIHLLVHFKSALFTPYSFTRILSHMPLPTLLCRLVLPTQWRRVRPPRRSAFFEVRRDKSTD